MSKFDFVANEHAILKQWDEIGILNLIREKNAGGEKFRSLDGPITANAPMGVHHAWSRTLKDAQIKYNVLKGRTNQFQNGFDAQGMWVEVEVEKALGLKSKRDIETFGLANFTEKCIERVNHFAKIQTNQSKRLGQIMDWENSYFTNSDHNIECIWNFLKVVADRGWLKKSYKPMPWCPRCGTSLSEHEMSGQYREVTHKAVFARLKLADSDEKIVIWTTTPWTLAANVAVAINPDNTYVKIELAGEVLIVGKVAVELLRKQLRIKHLPIITEFKGSELVGRGYIRPLASMENKLPLGTIIPWDEVSATEGSGLVHIAPGCGAEDYRLGVLHNLEKIIPVGEDGRFLDGFGKLSGLSTEEATDVIFEMLCDANQEVVIHDYSHNYPFCWRCKTDVIFRLVEGWDIATTDVKPAIFDAIKTVKWHPSFLQKNMEQWITQMGDWNISRRRFYGLPLPFYPCDNKDCGHVNVIGSVEELKMRAVDKSAVDKIPHLHRPYIDDVKIKCSRCESHVSRVPDVGDCWLDAGITPFSTLATHPAEVVIEMKEQIRLWFYAQLFMSVVLTGKAPYENVVGFGTMLAEDGKKFSKTGFHIPFDTAAEEYGADAIRYVSAGANPSHDMLFGPNMIAEAKRKLLSVINAVSFYTTYAAIDKPDISKHKPKNLHITDVWLIESMNKFIVAADVAYAGFKTHLVPALVEEFVENLSNFYIRTNRRRFWKGEHGTDKLNAYWVLHKALESIAVVLAPITPFLSEYLHKQLNPKSTSVLLAKFPSVENSKSPEVIDQVAFIQSVTTLAHKLRATNELKVRQPLATLYIKSLHLDAVNLFADYLREELNVKNIELVTDEDKFNTPYLTVNFKEAGKVLGKGAQELKLKLEKLTDAQMIVEAKKFDTDELILGQASRLFERKLSAKDGFVAVTEGDLTVVLDTVLTPELIEEGKLRELIRQIQVARQDADLEITQRVKLDITADSDELAQIIEKHCEKIKEEVLATELNIVRGKKFAILLA